MNETEISTHPSYKFFFGKLRRTSRGSDFENDRRKNTNEMTDGKKTEHRY